MIGINWFLVCLPGGHRGTHEFPRSQPTGSSARLLGGKVQAGGQDGDVASRVHCTREMDVTIARDESKGRGNLWAIAAGAAAGGILGYVLSTRGRNVLHDTIEVLDDFAAACTRFSQACASAQLAASDSCYANTRGVPPKLHGAR